MKSIPSYLKNLSTVAALLLIVLVVACNKKPDDNPIGLFEQNFEPYSDIITERGNIDKGEEALSQAMTYYSQKEYDQAIPLFDELLLENPLNDSLNFYSGIAYLASKQPTEAITRLQDVMDMDDSKFTTPAMWYLGLAYIEADQRQMAAEIFNYISQTNSSYKEKSDEILSMLSEIKLDVNNLPTPEAAINVAEQTYFNEEGFESFDYLMWGPNKELSVRATKGNQDLLIRFNKLNTANAMIHLYNNSGKLLHTEEHNSLRQGTEVTLDLRPYNAGVYNLHFRLDNSVQIKKKVQLEGAM